MIVERWATAFILESSCCRPVSAPLYHLQTTTKDDSHSNRTLSFTLPLRYITFFAIFSQTRRPFTLFHCRQFYSALLTFTQKMYIYTYICTRIHIHIHHFRLFYTQKIYEMTPSIPRSHNQRRPWFFLFPTFVHIFKQKSLHGTFIIRMIDHFTVLHVIHPLDTKHTTFPLSKTTLVFYYFRQFYTYLIKNHSNLPIFPTLLPFGW